MRKYKLNEHFFRERLTEKSAYWLGYLMADGSILMDRRGSKYKRNKIVLVSKDKEQIEKFREDIQSNYPIKYEAPKLICFPNKPTYLSNGAWRINIYSSTMTKDLIKHGITPRKSLTATFPKLPDKDIRHFIRGYFDGDGSIWEGTKGWMIGFYGTKPLLLSIRKWLKQKLFISNGCLAKHATIYRLYYGGNILTKRILDFLYSGATVWMNRKHKRYEMISPKRIRYRKIYQSLGNKVIAKYNSISEAGGKTGVRQSNIRTVLTVKNRYTAGGFGWKYGKPAFWEN